jgi:SAM-dependent methyltransferase
VEITRDARAVASSAIEVGAPPEVVWEVLTDFERWPAWNPNRTGSATSRPRWRHGWNNGARSSVCEGVTAGRYAYDQSWRDEQRRLAAMEDLWDPGTKAVIESLGIAPGWRCLEVGAGAGSIARWLAGRVGGAEVLATDVSTRHLEPFDGVEVCEHDILEDPLPDAHFDLVHARLLFEHLGRPALERMVPALRPGGWLVLEDYDWASAPLYPEDERMTQVMNGVMAVMSRSGYDRHCGRKLVHELERAGLEDVGADGRVRVYRGGSPAMAFVRLSIQSLGEAAVGSGDLTAEYIRHALARADDPSTTFVSAPMIAAWGRRP